VPNLFRANITATDDPLNVAINERIERSATAELPRGYLGASAVGHECMRQTQFDWYRKPTLPARVKTIFARGHFFEARIREHLIQAGFRFAPPEALKFVALDGDLQGHCDGVVIATPAMPGAYLAAPCVWECKCLNSKNFRAVARDGLERAFPRYAVQIWLYQNFLGKTNPALVSVANADTCELMHFALPFNAALAELWIGRAKDIIAWTRKGELLPRAFDSPDDWRCKLCGHRDKCWSGTSAAAA
jgi:hypothetical protein